MAPSPILPDQSDEEPPGDGRAVIRAALRSMPSVPGVYRMLNRRGEVLYVGKA